MVVHSTVSCDEVLTGNRWREDEEMIAQGLLVGGPNGEEFLLTTEPHLEMKRSGWW
ncbi:MAG: hypothetical protein HP496_18300 [Nitrospira sp.]|nr:hypothetical protein [Nitrospira sp.]